MLVREVLTGIIATAVTSSLIAWHFGRVSVVAPLSNILAGPVVAFLQPALFLALAIAPLHGVASLVADACTVPLALLDAIAEYSARVPFAALHVAPGLMGAACSGIAAAVVVRATASRRLARGLLVAAALLTLGIWSPLLVAGSNQIEVHMIDVGQGDAIAIRTPRGRWVVVDAGRAWDGGDAGRRIVVPYIRSRGGPIAAFVLTHAHDDHVGGAASLIDAIPPARWIESAFITPTTNYRTALESLKRKHVPWRRVNPGDSLNIDGVSLEILGPDSVWTSHQTNANETSVVLLVSYRGVRFMMTGDAELDEEQWLVDRWGTHLHADVLKLGHHGSRTSSSPEFVKAVGPVLGLISVGAANRYGHPSPEVLERFADLQVPLLRTDREGSIVVTSDGRRLQISSRRDAWSIPIGPTSH